MVLCHDAATIPAINAYIHEQQNSANHRTVARACAVSIASHREASVALVHLLSRQEP